VEYDRIFRDYHYGATIWSPLASGLLTGKYNNGVPADSRGTLKGYEWLREKLTDEKSLTIVRELSKLSGELGISLSHLALAWCLKNPNVSTVITGASRVEQVRENMKAINAVPLLTPEIMRRIDEIAGKPVQDPL
jgi:aryl-alcohol dehydrogenase-like predicted oxidoreductase